MKIFFGFHKYKWLYIIFLLSGLSSVQAKWVIATKSETAEALRNANDWYKKESYAFSVSYLSFENSDTKVPSEKSDGYVKKSKDNFHSYLLGIHTIKNKSFQLVVDSALLQIVVSSPSSLEKSSFGIDECTKALGMCKSILKMNSELGVTYKLILSENNTIGAYDFFMDKNGQLKSIVMYYNHEIKEDDGNKKSKLEKPRLEIQFRNFSIAPKLNYSQDFDDKKYIVISQKDRISTTQEFKKYKILDQRIPTNN